MRRFAWSVFGVALGVLIAIQAWTMGANWALNQVPETQTYVYGKGCSQFASGAVYCYTEDR